jgi:hypothetical protein
MEKQNQQLSQTTVMRSCSGQYYNFKKGMEICKNKENCPFYDRDFYDTTKIKGLIVRFFRIHQFRNCNYHLEKP